MFVTLSEERVLLLLNSENDDVRKITALKCLETPPKSRVTKLLQRYTEGEEYRYYNVIHWLDLGSTMPRGYAREIARSEVKNL